MGRGDSATETANRVTPFVDRIPSGSRAKDFAFNVLDGVIVAGLLAAFLLVGWVTGKKYGGPA